MNVPVKAAVPPLEKLNDPENATPAVAAAGRTMVTPAGLPVAPLAPIGHASVGVSAYVLPAKVRDMDVAAPLAVPVFVITKFEVEATVPHVKVPAPAIPDAETLKRY